MKNDLIKEPGGLSQIQKEHIKFNDKQKWGCEGGFPETEKKDNNSSLSSAAPEQ